MPMNPQIAYALTGVTAAYTANPGDTVLVTVGATANAVITLPPVASCFSPVIVRKVDGGTGTVSVVTADGSKIDGVTGTVGLTSAATAHTGWTFAPNAQTSWNVVGS